MASSTTPSSSSSSSSSMWWDLSLQAIAILGSALMYLWMYDIPRKLLAKYYLHRNKSTHESRRHFVLAADHLSRAQSFPKLSPSSISAANSAASSADAAITLNPSDAANHIIKTIALDLQGFKTSALDSIDVALSPLAVGSLSAEERADAMVKRAELRVEVSRLGPEGVEAAVWRKVEVELREAVAVRPELGRGWVLLGECCEELGKREEAKEAFQEAVRVMPDSVKAKQGLERLGLD